MIPESLYRKVSSVALALTGGAVLVAACAPGGGSGPRLRIHNQGATPIVSLSVIFPEDEVVFGDVPGGVTTEYVNVPNGVYGYAAYRFELDGEVVTQPVIDWGGELPLEGSAFTYTIQVDSSAPRLQTIQLVSVNRDS